MAYPLKRAAPSAHTRGQVGGKLDLGVARSMRSRPAARASAPGIFSGSGVGKSTLLAMLRATPMPMSLSSRWSANAAAS